MAAGTSGHETVLTKAPVAEAPAPARVAAAGVVKVNLLPPEITVRDKERRVGLLLGGAVVIAAAGVGAVWYLGGSSVDSAQTALQAAQDRHQALVKQRNQFASVTSTFQAVDAAIAMRDTALAPRITWSAYLSDLSEIMPPRVWLTSLTITEQADAVTPALAATASSGATGAARKPPVLGPQPPYGSVPTIGDITVSGVALAHPDVAAWLTSVADENGWDLAYLSSAAEQKIGPTTVVSFTSTTKITPPALAGADRKGS